MSRNELATAAACAVALLAACGTPPPLELEYDGCLYTLAPAESPTCVLEEGAAHLRLWVRSSAGAPIVVGAGGRRWLSADAEKVQGGYLFDLRDLGEDREVVVRAGTRGAKNRRTLPLSTSVKPPFAGESRQQLEARLAGEVPLEERGYLLRALAAKKQQAGQYAAAARDLDAAAGAYQAAGQLAGRIAALSARHFLLSYQLGEFEESVDVLATLPPGPKGEGRSAFFNAFYRGAWANRTGRFRTALRELETAVRQSERLGMGMRHFPEQERVHLLSRLGRYAEARRTVEWLEAEAARLAGHPHVLAQLFSNVGWSQLLMLEAGQPSDPVPALTRALSEARTSGDQELIRNAEINLTLSCLYAGRLTEAREHFARVTELGEALPWWIRVWSLDVEARIDLAEDRPDEALKRYRQLAARPEAKVYPDAEWRAAVGEARALEGLGLAEEALAAYERAEAGLWRASLAVPLDEGRRSSVDLYRRGTVHHLELLRALGREREALELARRSRARIFLGLLVDARLEELGEGEKERWYELIARYRTLQRRIEATHGEAETAAADRARALRETKAGLEDELADIFDDALSLLDAGELAAAPDLPPLRDRELLLVFHPLEAGWLAFAADAGRVEAALLPALDPALLDDGARVSEVFLGPFAEAIRGAERIRILPWGELWRIHFQALPFDGGILLEEAPVAYGLDLPPRDPEPSRDALLVADPTGSLAHAANEVAYVKRRLEDSEAPWQLHLLAPAEATVAAAREELAAAGGLFHFSGHGDLVGWEGSSGLVFEENFEGKVLLTIRDVLTLGTAPATVVLSACQSVRPSSLEAPASLGVGHAFLLAGSQSAVGALEKVDDARAGELVRLFYRSWRGPGFEADALRRAQLELYRRSSPGWEKFRVLER